MSLDAFYFPRTRKEGQIGDTPVISAISETEILRVRGLVGKTPGLFTATYTNGHDEEVFVQNDLTKEQANELKNTQSEVIIYRQLPPEEK